MIEALISKLLSQRKLRLAVAESCTGGLVCHRITNVAGSSNYFMGGVVSYSNEAKMNLLGVSPESLEQHGAVSQETVEQMARGVRTLFGVDVGMGISGIAGPGGATPGKPVGLTWIGISTAEGEKAWQFTWQGDRLAVKEQTAEKALQLLLDYLEGR